MTNKKLEALDVEKAMNNVEDHEKVLISEALNILGDLPGISIYGPKNPENRTSLVSFNCEGKNPFKISEKLSELGVESRAGCHCATLAHYYYELNPPASCRLSFYIYNDIEDVKKACSAVKDCI